MCQSVNLWKIVVQIVWTKIATFFKMKNLKNVVIFVQTILSFVLPRKSSSNLFIILVDTKVICGDNFLAPL